MWAIPRRSRAVVVLGTGCDGVDRSTGRPAHLAGAFDVPTAGPGAEFAVVGGGEMAAVDLDDVVGAVPADAMIALMSRSFARAA